MIPDDNFLKMYLARRVCEPAKKYIDRLRKAPAHVPRGSSRAVTGIFESRKIGESIHYKGHMVQLPLIIQMEHDPDVLAYYDGLEKIKLTYELPDGKKHSELYAPTFLKITEQSIVFVECWSESELEKLFIKSPWRYTKREENGHTYWACPPGEETAKKWGFEYQVWSTAEINWHMLSNMGYLTSYYTSSTPLVPDENITKLALARVELDPGISFKSLRDHIEESLGGEEDIPGTIVQTLNILLVQQKLFVNLQQESLTDPEHAHVFADAETAAAFTNLRAAPIWDHSPLPSAVLIAAGERVLWGIGTWIITDFDDSNIELLKENSDPLDQEANTVKLTVGQFETFVDKGYITSLNLQSARHRGLTPEGREKFNLATAEDLEKANHKMRWVMQAIQAQSGQPLPKCSESEKRARRRANKDYREGEIKYGNGYIGLLPKYGNCGDSSSKLPAKTQELLLAAAKVYEVPDRPTKKSVFIDFMKACEIEGTVGCSIQTFCDYLNKRPFQKQLEAREGTRAAYASADQYMELEYTTPRHGEWPMQIAHMDHTLADVELRTSDGTLELGRVWVSFMICTFTRRILAVYCTYDDPSYRTNMMLLRECVRRTHRLPKLIVVDGGADFRSTYFESFLALRIIDKKTRPKARPRTGTIIERLVLTSNTEFFWRLQGNTQNTKNVRQMTPEIDPKKRAVWSMGLLYEALCYWAYEIYDTTYHTTLGMTPREAGREGFKASGSRDHEKVAYDMNLIRDTMPTTKKGTAKVQEEGVKINGIYYKHPKMSDIRFLHKQVPVRYDPLNMAIAYAYLDGWEECKSVHYAQLRNRTEKEIRDATAKVREKNRALGRRFTLTIKQLADYIISPEAARDLQLRRIKDKEAQPVFQKILGNIPSYTLWPAGTLADMDVAQANSWALPAPHMNGAGEPHDDAGSDDGSRMPAPKAKPVLDMTSYQPYGDY
jgi:putative transposase